MGSTKKYAIIFALRFLSVLILTTSVLACFGAYHTITVERGPIVQQILGYNCSDFASYRYRLCAEMHIQKFTLWGVEDEFSLSSNQGLCHQQPNSIFNLTDSVLYLLEGNIGDCTQAALTATVAFAAMTPSIACIAVIWIILFADRNEHTKFPVRVHIFLTAFTMISSAICIAIYCIAINPMRLNPRFCDAHYSFQYCKQETGPSFWLEVSTVLLSFTSITIGVVARYKGIIGYETDEDTNIEEEEEIQPFFHKAVHFWIKLGRLLEFLVMLIAVVSFFTVINASVEPGSISIIKNEKVFPLSSSIGLWQGIFCSSNLLWWNFIFKEPVDTFGQCDDKEVFHTQFATIKVLISSGLALVLKRDAKQNPLFYLVGVVMDFLSLVFISLAIGMFYGAIYPGRNEVQPSYCELWTDTVGTACSMRVGSGFVLFCIVLVITTSNFIVEFYISERGQTYGARSAYRTVRRRIQQGRFQSVYKPTSTILPSPDRTAQDNYDADRLEIIEEDEKNSSGEC